MPSEGECIFQTFFFIFHFTLRHFRIHFTAVSTYVNNYYALLLNYLVDIGRKIPYMALSLFNFTQLQSSCLGYSILFVVWIRCCLSFSTGYLLVGTLLWLHSLLTHSLSLSGSRSLQLTFIVDWLSWYMMTMMMMIMMTMSCCCCLPSVRHGWPPRVYPAPVVVVCLSVCFDNWKHFGFVALVVSLGTLNGIFFCFWLEIHWFSLENRNVERRLKNTL